MKCTYDENVDAFYLRVALHESFDGEVKHMISALVAPVSGAEINLDFDAEGRFIGLECLSASRVIDPEVLATAEKLD